MSSPQGREWLDRVRRAIGEAEPPFPVSFVFSLDDPIYFGREPGSPRGAVGSTGSTPNLGEVGTHRIGNAERTGRYIVLRRLLVHSGTTSFIRGRVHTTSNRAHNGNRAFRDLRYPGTPVAEINSTSEVAPPGVLAFQFNIGAGEQVELPVGFVIAQNRALSVHSDVDVILNVLFEWDEYPVIE